MSVALNRNRTRPVSSVASLSNALVWLPSRVAALEAPYYTMPLSEIVRAWTRQPIANLAAWRKQKCVYGQIGLHDGCSFPVIPPGAFIQIDPDIAAINGATDPHFYFVRHPFGYSCCRCAVENGRIFLLPCSHLYPQLEFEHPGVVRVIGRVRAFCGRVDGPAPPPGITLHDLRSRGERMESLTRSGGRTPTASEILHRQRCCLGITYAELDDVAERVRGIVPNREHFRITGGHAHKIDHDPDHVPSVRTLFPLLALYGLDFDEALRAYGLSVDDTNMIELPALYGTSTVTELAMAVGSSPFRSQFALSVLDGWLEWPALLCHLRPDLLAGSIYFYAGDARMEPIIKSGSFLLIDAGHVDIPADTESSRDATQWERPLFLFRLRDCGFVAGYAERSGGRIHIIAHPGAADQRLLAMSNAEEGATVGRIVAVASVV